MNKYLNSLLLDINDARTNYNVSLKGFNQIKKFFQSEVDFWSELDKKPQFLNRFININNSLNDYEIKCKSLTGEPLPPIWETIKKNVSLLTSDATRVIYSNSMAGSIVKNLYSLNLNEGNGAYQFFAFNTNTTYAMLLSSLNQNSQNFLGYLKAAILSEKLDQAIPDIKNTIKALTKKWQETTANLEHNFEDVKVKHEDWKKQSEKTHEQWQSESKLKLEEELTERQKRLDNLEKTYNEKLQLEAPVKYWETRVGEYRNQGRWWLVGLTGVSVILIGILLCVLYNLPNSLTYNLFSLEPQAIKGILILVTLVSFGAYLVRVFSRLTFSCYHLVRDAEERKQLTLVFLSLLKDGVMVETERNIVLQSLFSRVETGLLGADSAPEMPGIGMIMDRITKTGK